MISAKVVTETKLSTEANQAVLIRNTDYEELIKKYSKERETVLASDFNQNRLRNIIKSIASVYYFLRCMHGIGHRDLSLEEFEIGEAYLRRVGEQEARKPIWRFLKSLGILSPWDYYLVNNYFRVHLVPRIRYPKEFKTNWYYSHSWHSYDYDTFETNIERLMFAIPPNINILAREVLEKRQGTAI